MQLAGTHVDLTTFNGAAIRKVVKSLLKSSAVAGRQKPSRGVAPMGLSLVYGLIRLLR